MVAVFAIIGLTLSEALSLLFLILFKIFSKKIKLPTINNSTYGSKQIIKDILSIAIPITLSSAILNMNKLIDMAMILNRLSAIGYTQEQSNAIYGAYSTMAISIYNLPSTFVSAIAIPLIPILTYEIENKNEEKIRSVISSAYKLCAIIAFPAGLGISVFSKPILQLLFSSQVEEIDYTAPLLSLLGISIFISSMITVTNAVLQSYKQVKKPIISMIIGTVCKLILSYLLIGIPKVNVYGAPISTFFSTLIVVSLNLYFILRVIPKPDKIYNLFLKPFIAALLSIMVGIAIFITLSCFSTSKIIILVTIALVMIIYLFAIIKTKAITDHDILLFPKGNHISKILKKLHLI
jgi:stage V sporulation protein B